MHLPTGAMLALIIILLVGACETMLPTGGASQPADRVENNTNDGGSSRRRRDGRRQRGWRRLLIRPHLRKLLRASA